MNRTILAIRNKHGKFIIPKFSDCVLEFFGSGINSVTVNCSIENDMLVLNESENGCELRHSTYCPIKLSKGVSHSSEEDEGAPSTIGLAACVAVESSDSHILLTKRSPNLRSSPNTWVLPGGHLEYGETVFQAGIRETREETALDITTEKSSILGLWESVYPAFLGLGKPRYHVLIVYLHINLDETYEELTKRIIPNPAEVNSYCWINATIASQILDAKETITTNGIEYAYENGKFVEKVLNYQTMFSMVQPVPYTGVNFALRKWVERINSGNSTCKF